jgi:hypothetical protein
MTLIEWCDLASAPEQARRLVLQERPEGEMCLVVATLWLRGYLSINIDGYVSCQVSVVKWYC